MTTSPTSTSPSSNESFHQRHNQTNANIPLLQDESSQHSPLPTTSTTLTIEDGDSSPQCPYDPNLPPLDERVLTLVRTSKNLTIRPARLTSELGLSIEDASAELCGLLSAVGSTATFRFESVRTVNADDTMTMVFTFPQDFERRARNSRRKTDAKAAVLQLMRISLKLAKVVVAFGLIVSLAVVVVFGLCAMVALVVALSRSGGNHDLGRRRTGPMVRMIMSTFRELLWIFVVFGPDEGDGMGAPYWRETARNTLGLCYGPTSPWFWLRMGRWNRGARTRARQGGLRQEGRSWNTTNRGFSNRRGVWSDEEHSTSTNRQLSQQQLPQHELPQQQRGILSVAVEFLFGPTPFFPGPSERQKWKIRQKMLVTISSSPLSTNVNNNRPGVSLAQILPFVDQPPSLPIQSSLSSTAVVSEALKVVSHFNGVPVKNIDTSNGAGAGSSSDDNGGISNHDLTQFRFVFPELMSEEAANDSDELTTALGDSRGLKVGHTDKDDDQTWESFLYANPNNERGPMGEGPKLGTDGTNGIHAGVSSSPLMYLKESRHVLTQLTQEQFGQCLLLNTINAVGIWMFHLSIEPSGLLEIANPTGYAFASGLLSFLGFYAKLFFALPFARMVYIVLLNLGIEKRNGRRKDLVERDEEGCTSSTAY